MTFADKLELRFRNLELERQLLAYALRREPGALSKVLPAWFSLPLHSSLCALLQTTQTVLTTASLIQAARRQKIIAPGHEKAAVAAIRKIDQEAIGHVTKRGAELMAQQLAELYDSSRIAVGVKDIAHDMGDGWDLDRARSLLKSLAQPSGSPSEKGGDYLEDYEERVAIIRERAAMSEADTGLLVPTGIAHFDRWLGGGLLKLDGEFGIILGRTNIGKSATLVSFGAHAFLHDYNVVFCSGEMSKESVEFRTDAHLAAIPGHLFREGNLSEAHWRQWDKTIRTLQRLRSNYFEVLTFPRRFTMEHVEQAILEVEDRHGAAVDLVLLDYINILEPKQGTRGEWKSQADVVWDFKGFLKEHNGGTAGWAPGQIVDEAVGKDVLGVQDAKYARAISETAPIVVGLVQTDEDSLMGRLQFQTVKLRESRHVRRVVYLHPNLDIMRINEDVIHHSLKDIEGDVRDLNEIENAKQKKGRS